MHSVSMPRCVTRLRFIAVAAALSLLATGAEAQTEGRSVEAGRRKLDAHLQRELDRDLLIFDLGRGAIGIGERGDADVEIPNQAVGPANATTRLWFRHSTLQAEPHGAGNYGRGVPHRPRQIAMFALATSASSP